MSEAIVSDGTDNPPETREEDHAAIVADMQRRVTDREARTKAAEAALDLRRRDLQTSHPLDLGHVHLVLHTWPGYIDDKWNDRRCHRCGGPYDAGCLNVHLVLGQPSPSIDGALCGACVELGGQYGTALLWMRDALEGVDTALHECPDDRLPTMALLAENALGLIARANFEAEQKRFIASATADIQHLAGEAK
jgi:hypothetical protein